MSRQLQLSSWKKLFLPDKDLDSSNKHMDKIMKVSNNSVSFPKSLEEISKNPGVSFLFLDPTETHLQLLHHGNVLGGNWSTLTKKLVAVLGVESDAKPVQIIQKSVKNIREKSFDWPAFEDSLTDLDSFKKIANPTEEFEFKNIIPIPNFLMKIFIQLSDTDPFDVAKAFLNSILERNKSTDKQATDPLRDVSSDPDSQEISKEKDKSFDVSTVDGSSVDLMKKDSQESDLYPEDILYSLQFCQLCVLGKIPPVLYSLVPDHTKSPDQSDNSVRSSPENKVSKKDHYLINTMIKLHDTMDKTSKTKEEKKPGFKRLESHRKRLILNASAVPPFNSKAATPTEFYNAGFSLRH